MGGELADSSEEGKVKCSCIKEQAPNYLLNPSLLCGRDWVERVVIDEGEGWRGVRV